MVNVTHPFNSTAEFWGAILKNASYGASGNYIGLLLGGMMVMLVHSRAGFRGSVPLSVAMMLLLPEMGLLPTWIQGLTIILVSLSFAIFAYERWVGSR